jgi:hypothetical protein
MPSRHTTDRKVVGHPSSKEISKKKMHVSNLAMTKQSAHQAVGTKAPVGEAEAREHAPSNKRHESLNNKLEGCSNAAEQREQN